MTPAKIYAANQDRADKAKTIKTVRHSVFTAFDILVAFLCGIGIGVFIIGGIMEIGRYTP